MTKTKLCKQDVNVAKKGSDIDLWHKRLGHISEKGMHSLAHKDLLPEVKGMTLRPCVDCLDGKQHRVAFCTSTTPHRANDIFDLVHTDVCSITENSLRGAIYFVTITDDHSRKIFAYVLKNKFQVLDAFKEFHAMVERETGRKLKCIRSDNGGEYRGPFERYCKMHGIRQQKTVPKTPQQNGLAQRMNRTLTERVTTMLSHAKLPNQFWAEALMTALYVINWSPCVPLGGDIPQRVWSGKEVSYKHLRVFGCRAFVHVPKDERSKLESKTK